ncbi:MAG: hypothetical protein H0T62_09215 [Parachlamydiaceae bacterium]|nr:hypothetical protein [Parachlamydiaceae bacterium]
MGQPLTGVDNTTVICCGIFTVDKDNWEGVIALTDGVKRTVVYIVGGSVNLLKQATGSIDGWKKLAGVITPLAALMKFGEFAIVAEALEAISAQFETVKLLLSGTGGVNIIHDFLNKDFVENSKSKHNNHGENYVAVAKRILLIGVNTLKLVKFGNKIGLCVDVASEISKFLGGIPVMSILLAGVTTLSLIGNGLTFWTISNDKDDVIVKINRFMNNQSGSPERTRVLKEKLEALLKSTEVAGEVKSDLVTNENIGSEEELSGSGSEDELTVSEDQAIEDGEIRQPLVEMGLSDDLQSEQVDVIIKPADKYYANFTYTQLKQEIARVKNEAKTANALKVLRSKKNDIIESSRAIDGAILGHKDVSEINALREKNAQLYVDCAKITEQYKAIKAEFKAYNTMTAEQFRGYKKVQLFARMSELDQKRDKELRDFVINLITIPGIVLGLIKDISGLGAIMDLIDLMTGGLIHVDDEDMVKAFISGVSLMTGGFELWKFLYEENHKDEPQKISAAAYKRIDECKLEVA